MKRIQTFVIFILLCLTINCNFLKPSDDTEIENPILISIRNDIPEPNNDMVIKGVTLQENTLQLIVSYGGGCKEHTFKAYALDTFAESDPVQAYIFLHHNNNGDTCEALIMDTLKIDINPLKKRYQQMYSIDGSMLLRIHEPNAKKPLTPLPLYEFGVIQHFAVFVK